MSYRTANLQMFLFFIYSTNIRTEYFKHAAYSVFSSSKRRLFHNDTFFGSCIIHIYIQGVLKFKRKFRRLNIYICRTAQLTSRCCIFLIIHQIYVPNILNKMHTLCFFLFKTSFIS